MHMTPSEGDQIHSLSVYFFLACEKVWIHESIGECGECGAMVGRKHDGWHAVRRLRLQKLGPSFGSFHRDQEHLFPSP